MKTLPTYTQRFLILGVAVISSLLILWMVGYSAGLTAFKNTQTGGIQVSPDPKSVIGRITNISGTTITIETFLPDRGVKKVLTDEKTIFERTVPKDPETFQEEVESFNEKMRLAQKERKPFSVEDIPAPFALMGTSLDDLIPGAVITATAEEDIPANDQFIAVKIILASSSSVGNNAPTLPSQ